jgi:membrane protein DedA with SNARE-associated domain
MNSLIWPFGACLVALVIVACVPGASSAVLWFLIVLSAVFSAALLYWYGFWAETAPDRLHSEAHLEQMRTIILQNGSALPQDQQKLGMNPAMGIKPPVKTENRP